MDALAPATAIAFLVLAAFAAYSAATGETVRRDLAPIERVCAGVVAFAFLVLAFAIVNAHPPRGRARTVVIVQQEAPRVPR